MKPGDVIKTRSGKTVQVCTSLYTASAASVTTSPSLSISRIYAHLSSPSMHIELILRRSAHYTSLSRPCSITRFIIAGTLLQPVVKSLSHSIRHSLESEEGDDRFME